MSGSEWANELSRDRLVEQDTEKVDAFNRGAAEKYRLRLELGPSAYEGNIDSARVILLLANPGYDQSSTIEDHMFERPGWPLGGLHPDAPPGMRSWWAARLRHLIEPYGAQHISNAVACLQLTPWASISFNQSLLLPSRKLILDAADACAGRGAVILVMRGERLWVEAPQVAASAARFRVKSWRCSYVSPGNLSAQGWAAVSEVLRSRSARAARPRT